MPRPPSSAFQSEAAEIALTTDGADDVRAEAGAPPQTAEAELAEAEAALSALQAQTSDLNARRAALERAVREEMERASRFRSEKERLEREIAALSASP